MTVKQGEQVTLVGRTGAGKSTVFKLLLGLYQPEAGTVTIGGVKVGDITTGSAAPASAVWNSISPACRAPCWNRSRWETRRSPGKWQGMPPHWPGSMLPSGSAGGL